MSFYLFGHKYTPGLDLKNNAHQKRQINCRKKAPTPSDRRKIANKDTFDPFNCSKNAPEAYQCYYCNFKADCAVEFNDHVARTKLKPSRASLKTLKYVCDSCNFETFSRLVLLKHAFTKCLLKTPDSVLVLARVPKSPSNCVKLLYCKPNLLKPSVTANRNDVTKPNTQKPKSSIRCEHCDFQTAKRVTLKHHVIKKHTPDEDINWFRCKHCPYKAKMRAQLNRHLFQEHTTPEKVIWYQCEDCDYRSIWKNHLLRHYKVLHTADKVYQCDQCPHKTKYVSHLRRHVEQQHSEDFQWLQCEHCPYKAKQKIHMKLHSVQRHTPAEEIEWYECDQCPYKAKIKASLKNHVLKKHAWLDQWLVCEKCGYKSKNKSSLKRHSQNAHG